MIKRLNQYYRSDIIEMSKDVSEKIGIPYVVIAEAYKSYWENIKSTIGQYDMSLIDSEEDLKNIQGSFNLKHIGKLHTDLKTIKIINKRIER